MTATKTLGAVMARAMNAGCVVAIAIAATSAPAMSAATAAKRAGFLAICVKKIAMQAAIPAVIAAATVAGPRKRSDRWASVPEWMYCCRSALRSSMAWGWTRSARLTSTSPSRYETSVGCTALAAASASASEAAWSRRKVMSGWAVSLVMTMSRSLGAKPASLASMRSVSASLSLEASSAASRRTRAIRSG